MRFFDVMRHYDLWVVRASICICELLQDKQVLINVSVMSTI
ncbi:hypothetical protein bcere0026_52130 [Bacillus mycoides]|uniref:Uncharacterized protein n=1 Tax=Bacillus mycoides TaxID=1405 RepID=C2Y2L6_BACMY|nr:hypothetical protein bcere0026_52130 [Bacillus mycoides]